MNFVSSGLMLLPVSYAYHGVLQSIDIISVLTSICLSLNISCCCSMIVKQMVASVHCCSLVSKDNKVLWCRVASGCWRSTADGQ